jgi:CBS-domain-containing membrane protein
MRAMDVMTTNVITVDPDTTVQAVAALLSERGISGVPVVDSENRLLGILSEGDLLHRVETGTERRPERPGRRRRSWWLDTIVRRGAGSRLCQIAWPHRQGCHDARGYFGGRHH